MSLPGFANRVTSFIINRTTADNISWAAITAPIDCNQVTLYNNDPNVDFKFRTNQTDPNTEARVYAGLGKVIGGSKGFKNERGSVEYTRFGIGDIIGYVQTISGVGPIVAEYLR
jgi:hypothetical protein